MNRSFKLSLISFFYLLTLSSCDDQNENVDPTTKEKNELTVEKLYDADSNLKREFGKALVKSLNESKALRDLIKNESLKMFDNDYDVLYQTIKDEKLENNITVRQSLIKNLGNESLLNQIEINNPTLTIFVPELPENSFSAKTWDTENQVPAVAIRLTTSNDVPLINQDGSEHVLEARYTPAFPVIVLKNNERIISNNAVNRNVNTRSVAKVNGNDYKFLDDCFDGSKNFKNQAARTVSSSSIDSKIITAYNTYAASNVDGWQRDYIYYNITPGTPKGPFKYDFQESIQSFSLQGDPKSAYNKIADQTGDPNLRAHFISSPGSPLYNRVLSRWTGGNFEFKIRVIVNGKNGVGSEIVKYFNAKATDLFDYTVTRVSWNGYDTKITGLKTMPLNIPIFNWDLDQYAASIKIDIEEIDLTETTILTESRSVEFASNFSVEASGSFFGELVKVGLKYGTSQKVTATSTVQRTFTQGNDLLGDVIVNFADNVIIGSTGSTYTTREYSSGLYSITVEPTRVQ